MKNFRTLSGVIAMIVVLLAAAYPAGDEIAMVVYGEKELSGSYKVGAGGTIAVPLIGEVNVGGLHLRAAEELVAAKLADGYLVEPSVTMQVTSARPVYILGEVKNPGSFAIGGDRSGHYTHLAVLRVTGDGDVYISEKE
jgi:protein involved in polysaccharide export with SLBB domain